VAALFGGRKLSVYAVDYDQEVAAGIIEAAHAFWRDHVLADKPPEVDGGADWSRFLSRRKHASELVLVADAQLDALGQRLGDVRSQLKTLTEQEQILRNTLLAMVDHNAGIKGTGWSATYRENADSEKIDWQGAFDAATRGSPPGHRLNLMSANTITKPGFRVFRYHRKGDKNE
jgi:predicted phage-related endonuclease